MAKVSPTDDLGALRQQFRQTRLERFHISMLKVNHPEYNRKVAFSKVLLFRFLYGPILAFTASALTYGIFALKNPFNPDNWWRCLLLCSTVYNGGLVYFVILTLDSLVFHNLGWKIPRYKALLIWLFSGCHMSLLWYLIWVVNRHEYPFYFHGVLAAMPTFVFVLLMCYWLLFPPRMPETLKKKTKYAFLFMILLGGLIWTYWVLMVLYVFALKWEMNWLVIVSMLLFSCCRLLYTELLTYIINIIDKNDASLVCIVYTFAYTNHTAFFVVSNSTAPWYFILIACCAEFLYTIAIFPFLAGVHDKPWWYFKMLNKRSRKDMENLRNNLVVAITIKGITEVLIPITIGLIFSVLYYSSNSPYFGGIGTSIWHYSELKSLALFWSNIGTIASSEFCTFILSSIVIHKYAQINVINVALATSKSYGSLYATFFSFLCYHMICVTIVHCGMDFTFSNRTEWNTTQFEIP